MTFMVLNTKAHTITKREERPERGAAVFVIDVCVAGMILEELGDGRFHIVDEDGLIIELWGVKQRYGPNDFYILE